MIYDGPSPIQFGWWCINDWKSQILKISKYYCRTWNLFCIQVPLKHHTRGVFILFKETKWCNVELYPIDFCSETAFKGMEIWRGFTHHISRVGNSGQRNWRKRSSKSKTCNIMLTRVCPCITEYNNSAGTKPLSSEAHCVCESHWYQYIHCLVSRENILISWSLEKRVVRVVGWLHVCCEGAHPCPRIRFYRCWKKTLIIWKWHYI